MPLHTKGQEEQEGSALTGQPSFGRCGQPSGQAAPVEPVRPLRQAHGQSMHQPCLSRQTPLQGLRAPQALPAASHQAKEGKGKEDTSKKGSAAGKDGDSFPDLEECLMIFGGSDAIHSKR